MWLIQAQDVWKPRSTNSQLQNALYVDAIEINYVKTMKTYCLNCLS